MNLNRLSDYLGRIERRLRVLTITQGAAAIFGAALVCTVLAVLLANYFAFSGPSVLWARILLFIALALAVAFGLILPLLHLNRRKAARAAEQKFPQFQERLLTLTEQVNAHPDDPFLELLAGDTLDLAQKAEPARVAAQSRILSFACAGAIALLVLVWLGTSGPGFLGYGTSLLWGGIPKGETQPFYDIAVQPGNRTVRKGADQMISARLIGFQAQPVRLFARYKSASKWEEAAMRPQPNGPDHEFLFGGIPESVEYYVEAGGLRSQHYNLNVIELPNVKKIRVTYHFPSWSGLKDAVEDPGGDLRAVEGTTADVAILTDRPLANGVLLLDDGSKLPLRSGDGNWHMASVKIAKDGMYHIAAIDKGDDVRMSEDYFIEAQKDQPPSVKITRPGRDARVNPVEEVTVAVEATDDFGLHDVSVHYSVNGGPEKTVSVLPSKGVKSANGSALIALEDYQMSPGDVVALYATAKDARFTAKTDIFFVEAQPFEKQYTQSQQMGGGGGGGGGDEDQNKISQREKEIIAATWNQLRDRSGDKSDAADNAKFLSEVQTKLKEQAASLAQRMKSRELSGTNESFKSFTENMDKAVAAMTPAAEQLKSQKWNDALPPETKALQYLLRAEATFRQIQVSFGRQRGGGGGGGASGATRDLEGLLDLELDTEKNQYETSQQSQSADQQQKQIDEALQKLEQLARRQQELAEQRKQNPQTSQQRWQQEMLRREAEQLQRQMQQLQRNQQNQQNQPGQQGQQGQPSNQGGQPSQQSGQSGRSGQVASQRLEEAVKRLEQAMNDMRQAQNPNAPQNDADARRAAERLQEAQNMLRGLQQQQNGSEVDQLAQKAEGVARQQEDFAKRLRKSLGNSALMGQQGDKPEDKLQPGEKRETPEQLAQQKEQIQAQTQQIERDLQRAVRNTASGQRDVSNKLREALGEMQQKELASGMSRTSQWIRNGMGAYAVMREATTTEGLNRLADKLKEAQQMAGGKQGKPEDKQLEQALAQTEQIRQRMQALSQSLQRNGQQGKQGGQQGKPGQGQQGKEGQQPGQQSGQQPGQQAGQQPGSQGQQGKEGQGKQGQGQQGQGQGQGQQPGDGQQGGQQAGGQTGGGANGGPRNGWGPHGGLGPVGPGNYGGPYDGGYWSGRLNTPDDYNRAWQDGVRDLNRLQRELENQPDVARDVQNLVKQMQQLDPYQFPNHPELVDQILSRLLNGVEGVELELRRMTDDKSGGNVRSGSVETIPQGYADAVAEYRKRLSKK